MSTDAEVVVVGGGPAGLTAALFAARTGRKTMLIDPFGVGGSVLNTERIEDFPGFPAGVPGFDLGPLIQEQASAAGSEFELGLVERVESRERDWAVVSDNGEIVAGAVIVATGSSARKLGVPREEELEGKGISHCANCDGPFFRGKRVAVIGGGDSALLETIELLKYDVQAVVVHRDCDFVGQDTYSRRVDASPQVEVRPQTVVEEILGNGSVSGLRLRSLETGEVATVEVAGVFVHVGRIPNTALLTGTLTLDESGRVPTDISMRTERPGLFAAGDVRCGSAGQAITAAGDGATAAVAAHRYLTERS